MDIPEYRNPLEDPPGTVRRLTNGAIAIKRDRSLSTGMLWLVLIRPEGMDTAIMFDSEVENIGSEVIGAVPGTPAAVQEYEGVDVDGDIKRFRAVHGARPHVEMLREDRQTWLALDGATLDNVRATYILTPRSPSTGS
jgi:hypothetical protein